jgi:hypothetical protein
MTRTDFTKEGGLTLDKIAAAVIRAGASALVVYMLFGTWWAIFTAVIVASDSLMKAPPRPRQRRPYQMGSLRYVARAVRGRYGW